MNNPFDDYLNLLEQLSGELSRLSELARQKTDAVLKSDLTALNEVLKQEQAAALAVRGLEQKQSKLLNAAGLGGTKLSALAENYPPQKRAACKKVVAELQTQYDLYKASSEVARDTLECNLHEINKILASVEADAGPGYQSKAPDIPKPMKTDFRA